MLDASECRLLIGLSPIPRAGAANIAALLLLLPAPVVIPLLRRLPRPAGTLIMASVALCAAPAIALPLAVSQAIDMLRAETEGWDEFASGLDSALAELHRRPATDPEYAFLEGIGRFCMEMGAVLPASITEASLNACDARGLPLGPGLAMTTLTTLPALLAGSPLVGAGASLRLVSRILSAVPAPLSAPPPFANAKEASRPLFSFSIKRLSG